MSVGTKITTTILHHFNYLFQQSDVATGGAEGLCDTGNELQFGPKSLQVQDCRPGRSPATRRLSSGSEGGFNELEDEKR